MRRTIHGCVCALVVAVGVSLVARAPDPPTRHYYVYVAAESDEDKKSIPAGKGARQTGRKAGGDCAGGILQRLQRRRQVIEAEESHYRAALRLEIRVAQPDFQQQLVGELEAVVREDTGDL